jgi:uncharacterized membrane protein YhaH (DUF805 family)
VESRNPYTTPKANVTDPDEEYGEIKVFSASGRLGRVRYIGYSVGLPMLIGLLAVILSAAIGAFAREAAAWSIIVGSIIVVGYCAIFVVLVLLTIQRAHDFNTTGWLAFLIIVPLANLIFWFIPGTDGENQFGKKTPPNGIGVILLACIIPLIFVIGIVAAIAIPSYQSAVQRAKAAQVQK